MAVGILKKIALKTVATKAYVGARLKLSPSYQSAKKYSADAVRTGLFGTSLITTGKLSKASYRASQVFGLSEIGLIILKIIQRSYTSESFYKGSWKLKSRILAHRIARSSEIQIHIAEHTLYAIIYEILKENKNRQGNEKLAMEISQAVELADMGGDLS